MFNEMKANACTNAFEARMLRSWINQYSRKHVKATKAGRNSPFWLESMSDVQRQQNLLRQEQRYLYLARAFVSYKEYGQVENSCREGNEPAFDILVDTLDYFGFIPDVDILKNWLERKEV